MRIIVQLPDGKRLCLTVEPSDTVRALNARIEESTRWHGCRLDLAFEAMYLEDDRTLEDCGIKDGDYLSAQIRLKGGGCGIDIGLTFNSLNKEVVIPLSAAHEGQEHQIVTPGLIFKSKCLNPNCRVYNEVIYVNKGYSEGPNAKFNVGTLSVTLKCPICGVKAQRATSCGFILSQWTFTGATQEGDEVSKSGKTSTKNYHTWEEGDNIAYASLEVRVDPYNPE